MHSMHSSAAGHAQVARFKIPLRSHVAVFWRPQGQALQLAVCAAGVAMPDDSNRRRARLPARKSLRPRRELRQATLVAAPAGRGPSGGDESADSMRAQTASTSRRQADSKRMWPDGELICHRSVGQVLARM